MSKATTENGVEYGAKPSPMPKTGPTEASEHLRLVANLRRARIYFQHIPMGGARGRGSGAWARRMGASKSFPDILILDSPGPISWRNTGEVYDKPVGVALELKRCARGSKPSAEQVEHLERLAARGWLATVQWGCDAALEYLRGVGYEI